MPSKRLPAMPRLLRRRQLENTLGRVMDAIDVTPKQKRAKIAESAGNLDAPNVPVFALDVDVSSTCARETVNYQVLKNADCFCSAI